jgi:serine phosphatase RsbU (regulator of sigma subunit)
MTSTASHLVLCSPRAERLVPLADGLRRAGWEVAVCGPADFDGSRGDLFLLDEANDPERMLTLCRDQHARLGEGFVPIVYLAGEDRRRGVEAGADLVALAGIDPAELAVLLRPLVRSKQRHDKLASRAAEATRVHERLKTAYHQINAELELASRIQASFLPQSMPELPQVRFAVEFRPIGHVGGDFYDVFRLDERHFGFYVADAMGHGVGASLLTIFVKKGVRGKEIVGQNYRLVPPDEVLQRLNRDFIDQALSDAPFITMLYGLFDFTTGMLQFSRAGHPYPLHVPREGPAQYWQMEGSLLGVFATRYGRRVQELRPGDKVLFYTDAIDAARFGDAPVGTPSLLAAAEHFRDLPAKEFAQRLAIDLFLQAKQTDDLTLLVMEVPEAQG